MNKALLKLGKNANFITPSYRKFIIWNRSRTSKVKTVFGFVNISLHIFIRLIKPLVPKFIIFSISKILRKRRAENSQ